MGFNLRYSFSYFTGPNIVLTFKRRDWYNETRTKYRYTYALCLLLLTNRCSVAGISLSIASLLVHIQTHILSL